jgi:4-hydroxybutyryl-CoA dehydratase/vinylacetyl-CoA-Delta-isomerase
MSLMNGDQYRESIRKLKPVFYMFGQKIENPYDHPIVRASQNSYALTYDLACDPQYEDLMTATSNLTGKKINRFGQIYQSIDDMIKKVKMVRVLCQKAGTCIQRCPTMDTGNVLYMVTDEMDKKLGTEYHKRFLNFFREVQEKDLSVGVAMTDAKGSRALRPHEQADPDLYLHVVEEKSDGIVVRGAKSNQTGSINHHYTFVAPTAAVRAEDKDFALAFAVPCDAEGIIHICGRQPGDTRRLEDSQIDVGNCKYGCMESLMVFNDVFIPWERVFLYKEYEFAGRIPNLFGANHRATYGGCKAGMSDVLIGAVKLAAEYNGVDNFPHIRDKILDMVRLTETIYSCGLATAVEGQKMPTGSYFIDPLLANVCKINVAELPFEMSKLAVDILGGLVGTVVSEKELEHPEIGKYVDKYLKGIPNVPTEHKMRIITLIQNLLFGTNSVEYVVESVHGAGSPQAQKRSLNRLVDFEAKKRMAKEIAGIEDSKDS